MHWAKQEDNRDIKLGVPGSPSPLIMRGFSSGKTSWEQGHIMISKDITFTNNQLSQKLKLFIDMNEFVSVDYVTHSSIIISLFSNFL